MKRSYSFLNSYYTKRSKTKNEPTENLSSLTSSSLTFFIDKSKDLFINHLRIPPILFKHQLYSLKSNNRTSIDRQLQDMFNRNDIRLFHSDFGIMIMFTNDYHLLIEHQLNENNLSSLSIEKDRLKKRFIQDLLPRNTRLSIDKDVLENQFLLGSSDIHMLIQLGLLLPKQVDQYWFSIPNLASFMICIEKGRRTLLQILSRRMYREIPMNEFRLRDTKRKCLLGFDYHIHDLIGVNLAHIINTPTGSIVKTGPEKI